MNEEETKQIPNPTQEAIIKTFLSESDEINTKNEVYIIILIPVWLDSII